MDLNTDNLSKLIGLRAQNHYITRNLHCSEAVFLALNKGLGGDLSEEMTIRLASAFPEGLGGGGCICGAVSGGILALGLFLGRSWLGGSDENGAMPAAKELHSRIQDTFGSVCCSILKKENKINCTEIPLVAASLAANLILERRPELAMGANWTYLRQHDGKLASLLNRGKEIIRSKARYCRGKH